MGQYLFPGATWRDGFELINGVLVNADSLPSAVLYHNGAVDGTVTVTVTLVATGQYRFSATIPSGYNFPDHIQVWVSYAINGQSQGFWFEAYTIMPKIAGMIVQDEDENNVLSTTALENASGGGSGGPSITVYGSSIVESQQ